MKGCGCSEQTRCFPQGDRLISTSISSVENDGCDALDGIKKYWVWGGENAPWWTPESDGPGTDGYHPCLNLPANQILYCEGTGNPCPKDPDDPPCHGYVLKMTFPSCGGTDAVDTEGICPTECECDPFRLLFTGTVWNGGPQGPFSGGIYTFLCNCDELESCWPDETTSDPANFVYRVDWEFTREYSCCCPNLDKPTAPPLQATIDTDVPNNTCSAAMEGAFAIMTPDSVGGTNCKVWESGDITFQCDSGDSHTIRFSMECVGDSDGVFCCYDYEGTLIWPASGGNDTCPCDPADANVQRRAATTCDCDPPHFRFGPYRLWKADEEDTCCECCEEFWIVVTEAPN